MWLFFQEDNMGFGRPTKWVQQQNILFFLVLF